MRLVRAHAPIRRAQLLGRNPPRKPGRAPGQVRILACLAICATAFSACGVARSTASQVSAPRPVVAAKCPKARPTRSSPGSANALAPAHPAWTTFCVYSRGRVSRTTRWRYGPLDRALNSSVSRPPAGYVCAAWVGLPSLVVLTYRHAVRYVVLEVGGCPEIVMGNGTMRLLTGSASGKVLHAYDAGAFPSS